MGAISNQEKRRRGGLIVEHLAALAVIGCASASIVTVAQVHRQFVSPERNAAYAAQVALNTARVYAATGTAKTHYLMGHNQFTSQVTNGQIEVTMDGSKNQWTFTTGLHAR